MERSQYPGPKKVMTVREVAAYLSVHPSTIYRLLKHNQIPAFHTSAVIGALTSKRSTTGADSKRSRATSRLRLYESGLASRTGVPRGSFLANFHRLDFLTSARRRLARWGGVIARP
jgi:hypothetical protein